MTRYRINLLTIVACLSLVLALVAFGKPTAAIGAGQNAEAALSSLAVGSGTFQINVLANQPWTDTGIDLTAGSTVSVSATGLVNTGDGYNKTPAGVPSYVTNPNFVAPNFPAWSLIGNIANSTAFEVGYGLTFQATAGRLYLGMNDDYFGDNSGYWTATVTISPTSLTLNPTSGVVGSIGIASGSGFAPNSGISLKITNGSSIVPIGAGPCTTDSSGAFTGCSFTIPTVTGGAHSVYATDGTSKASATFTVTPTLTLGRGANGVPGSTIGASARGFAASTTVAVTIGGASATAACVTDTQGSFNNCIVTIPTVYTFVASDGSGDTTQQSITLK